MESLFKTKNLKDLELEVKFKTNVPYTYQQYTSIINYLLLPDNNGLNLTNYKKTIRLDIDIGENRRIEINNIEDIKLYWLRNNFETLKNVKYGKKVRIKDVEIKDFNLKLSLSKEEELDVDKIGKINNALYYRLKNSYNIISSDNKFRFDISAVKSVKGEKGTLFKQLDIFNKPPVYEIEMEYIGGAINGKKELDNVIDIFYQNVRMILSVIQDNELIISQIIETTVKSTYNKLASKMQNMELYKIERVSNPWVVSPVTLHPINISQLGVPNIIEGYSVTYKADGLRYMLYIMDIKDDPVLNGNVYLIDDTGTQVRRTGYKAVDWAGSIIEGEWISDLGLYLAYDILIAKNNDIRELPLQLAKTSDKTRTSYLNRCIKDINATKGRFTDDAMQPLFTNVNVSANEENDRLKMMPKLEIKQHLTSNKKNEIFRLVTELDNIKNTLEYNIDGYIFTPSEEGYPKNIGRWNNLFKWKPPEQNSIDFLIKIEKVHGTNDDLVLPLLKTHINSRKDKKTTDIEEEVKQYKTLILFVGAAQEVYDTQKKMWIKTTGPMEFNPYNLEYEEAKKYNRARIVLNKRGKMTFLDESNVWQEIHDDTIVEFVYDTDLNEDFRWKPIKLRHDKTVKYKNGESIFGNYVTIANNNWESIVKPLTWKMLSSGTLPDNYLSIDKNIEEAQIDSGQDLTQSVINTVTGEEITVQTGYGCEIQKWNTPMRLGIDNFLYQVILRSMFSINIDTNNLDYKQLVEVEADKMTEMKKGKQDNVLVWGNNQSGMLAIWKTMSWNKVVLIESNENCIEYGRKYYNDYTEVKPLVTYLHGNLIDKLILPDYNTMPNSDMLNLWQETIPAKYMFERIVVMDIGQYWRDDGSVKKMALNMNDMLKQDGLVCCVCLNGEQTFNWLKGTSSKEAQYIPISQDGKPNTDVEKELLWRIEKKYGKMAYIDERANYGRSIQIYLKRSKELAGDIFNVNMVNIKYFIEMMKEYGFNLVDNKDLGQLYDESNIDSRDDTVANVSKISGDGITYLGLFNRLIFKKTKNVSDKLITKTRETKTIKVAKKKTSSKMMDN